MYYRASLSVVTLRQFLEELSFFVDLVSSLCNRLSLCPFIIFLNLPPICIDNWAEIFKFDFGFFNALFLEKRYIKKAF